MASIRRIVQRALIATGTVLLLGNSLPGQENDAQETRAQRDGYKQGVAEAEKELREGHATLYMSGLQMSLGLEHLDRETGLPFTIVAACVVDDQTVGRERGHEARIREHIKVHGLPAGSFKKWEKELFELKEYYDARTKTDKPIPLALGGPKRVSPDGKYTVTPIQMSFKKDDGTVSPILGVAIVGEGKKTANKDIYWARDETDFVWGPAGSRFMVIRCRNKTTRLYTYIALDLERVAWLRSEDEVKNPE